MKRRIAPLHVLLILALAGCATPAQEPPPPPEPAAVAAEPAPKAEDPPPPPAVKPGAGSLAKGIEAYENSQYKASRTLLRSALDSGLEPTDQVIAHKHLAFIACAGGQRETCKTHFRKAIAIDPGFALSRTEAGHPVWGKAFREVKAEQQKKKR